MRSFLLTLSLLWIGLTGFSQTPDSGWTDFKHAAGAFSVKFPAKAEYVLKETPNPQIPGGPPYKINMFLSIDELQQMVYVVRYNDYPVGTYLADKEVLFSQLEKEFASKGKLLDSAVKISKDGHDGRALTILLSDKYRAEIRLYCRGNRVYVLMRQTAEENLPALKDDGFFESFAFVPYQEPGYVQYEPKNKAFSMLLPSQPYIVRDTVFSNDSFLNNSVTYATLNTNSGGVYSIEHTEFSKYYQLKEADSLCNTMIRHMVKYDDSLEKTEPIDLDGIKGREFIVRKGSGKRTRNRVWIFNRHFYYLTSIVENEELFNGASNTFFTSFKGKGPLLDADLFVPKADRILEALQNPDTAVSREALGALDFYKFTPEDLPKVYAALKKAYPDDRQENGTRVQLLKVLQQTHDAGSFEQLTRLYEQVKPFDPIRAGILELLPVVDAKQGFDRYFKELTAGTPLAIASGAGLFQPLKDSLGYVALHLDQLLPLMESPVYRKQILIMTGWMVYDEDHPEYKAVIKTHADRLLAYSMKDLDLIIAGLKDEENQSIPPVYSYLGLMNELDCGKIGDTFTAGLLKQDSPGAWFKTSALTARIRHGLAIDQSLVNSQLDSLSTRYAVMEAFHLSGQLAKVPAKYKTQAEFARLCLYQYLDDAESYPSSISLLGSVTEKGQLYYVFSFVDEDEDENSMQHIGIAGPYQPGADIVQFKEIPAYTDFEPKEANWKAQALKMVPAMKEEQKGN